MDTLQYQAGLELLVAMVLMVISSINQYFWALVVLVVAVKIPLVLVVLVVVVASDAVEVEVVVALLLVHLSEAEAVMAQYLFGLGSHERLG